MANKSKLIFLSVFLIILMISSSVTVFLIKSFKTANALDFYTLENEQVIAITNVVGERKVSSFSSHKSKGISRKQYKYAKTDNVKGDVTEYIKTLEQLGFVRTTDINMSNGVDEIKLATKSIEKNKIIIVTIYFNEVCYTITIEKGKGSIQPYN